MSTLMDRGLAEGCGHTSKGNLGTKRSGKMARRKAPGTGNESSLFTGPRNAAGTKRTPLLGESVEHSSRPGSTESSEHANYHVAR